ncbi:MAG: hypothetical protein HYT46_03005 [Candidatus Vogelbacteria bacterium]|nr:hypothetical protein [Candidatus Vogelbacteria bacterium]
MLDYQIKIAGWVVLWLTVAVGAVSAQEFTSSSFKVLDPVLFPAGFSSSDDYQLWGSVSQPAIGTSTATDFGVRAGFLYFPAASAPAVTSVSDTGGGSSSGGAARVSAVEFSGLAYPYQPVSILQDGVRVATATAGANGEFEARAVGLTPGVKIFAVYAEDLDGQQSKLLTFPVAVIVGTKITVSGILIPPTVSSDKQEIKAGAAIEFFGQGPPGAAIELAISGSGQPFLVRTRAGADGRFRHQFATAALPLGAYRVSARVVLADGRASQFGRVLGWLIGEKTVVRVLKPPCPRPADLNGDCLVNLSDFSILIYWLDRPEPPRAVDLEPDGRVDLRDFSVAAYHWTG